MQIFLKKSLRICKKNCNFAKNYDRMNAEKLKNIVAKVTRSQRLSPADKAYIKELCAELGVELKPKGSRCKSCYEDAALLCYKAVSERGLVEEESAAAYVLKPWVDVFFRGVRVNAATLTDELAEWLIANGFDKDFFEKCK